MMAHPHPVWQASCPATVESTVREWGRQAYMHMHRPMSQRGWRPASALTLMVLSLLPLTNRMHG